MLINHLCAESKIQRNDGECNKVLPLENMNSAFIREFTVSNVVILVVNPILKEMKRIVYIKLVKILMSNKLA